MAFEAVVIQAGEGDVFQEIDELRWRNDTNRVSTIAR